MAKKWKICTQCKYISECKIGQVRTKNIELDCQISSDVGCYDYDKYFTLFNSIQLNLFKPDRGLAQAY